MTRAMLSSLAAMAVLAATACHAAAREPILPRKPKEIVVVGSSASKQTGALSGQQRRRAAGRKRRGSSYKNDFRCIPSSCPAKQPAAIGGQLQLLPPW